MVKRNDTQKQVVPSDSLQDNSDPHQEDNLISSEENFDALETHKTHRKKGEKQDEKRCLRPLPR
ncbi:MAG: hypothetical protein GF308_13470 [Candidatus Heimdallarchaeota archaeon]|nr:hypothetical protein [Candidatus Heimdallarchaeota archaeon]